MDYQELINKATAEMDKLINSLPVEQRADFNKYRKEAGNLIPDFGDIMSESFDYHKMKVEMKKRKKKLDKLNKEMLAKYGDISNK